MAANVKALHPSLIPSAPLVKPGHDYESISRDITDVILEKPLPVGWWITLGIGLTLLSILGLSTCWLFWMGTGIWGINNPVGWGFAIVNLVWWIGIGHAGTLISAILLIFNQDWRTAINRSSEAMTLFAVMCAGLFPILHLGRPWAVFFILPYPNTMVLWPQFRSPLLWDVFAISTYFTVSLLFWFTGLVPDLATLRDRAKNPMLKKVFGLFALGWRGSARHWINYEMAYTLLAGMSAPLVVSVHTVVSFDFAISVIPGWHTTIFPPYFVAGAIYSGFAMVLTIMLPARAWFHMEDFVTPRHIDNMAKVMLATGLVVVYGYFSEAWIAWYSGNNYEQFMMFNRMFGPYGWSYGCLLLCNAATPQLLWFKFFRTNVPALFAITIVVNIGMWLERFVIVVTSLARDFLPQAWGEYFPTWADWAAYVGSMGLFLTMMCLFLRALPMITIFELRLQHYQIKHGEMH